MPVVFLGLAAVALGLDACGDAAGPVDRYGRAVLTLTGSMNRTDTLLASFDLARFPPTIIHPNDSSFYLALAFIPRSLVVARSRPLALGPLCLLGVSLAGDGRPHPRRTASAPRPRATWSTRSATRA